MTGTITTTTAPNYQELIIQNQNQKEYMSILEKTNQQLSVWNNPYGIMVGILSALIAVGAIAVAIYLFKQSRDYREQQRQTHQKYEDSLNGLLESEKERVKEESEKHELIFKDYTEKLKSYSETLKEKENELQTLIETYEVKLTSTAAENQQEIKNILGELKKEKQKVISEISTPTVPVEMVNIDNFGLLSQYDNPKKIVIKCPNCNRGFYVENPHTDTLSKYTDRISRHSVLSTSRRHSSRFLLGDSNYEATCPYCGNKCYVDGF